MTEAETPDDEFASDGELTSDECSEDNDALIDEPCEGDLVTEDHLKFFTIGGCYRWPLRLQRPDVTVAEDEDWRVVVRAFLDNQQFWPNVWCVSDHGNWHLLSLEDEA